MTHQPIRQNASQQNIPQQAYQQMAGNYQQPQQMMASAQNFAYNAGQNVPQAYSTGY